MLVVSLPGENQLTAVKDADHFFTGKLGEVGSAISEWLAERWPRASSLATPDS